MTNKCGFLLSLYLKRIKIIGIKLNKNILHINLNVSLKVNQSKNILLFLTLMYSFKHWISLNL